MKHNTNSINNIVKLGLFVRLQSLPGKEAEVESFLKSGRLYIIVSHRLSLSPPHHH